MKSLPVAVFLLLGATAFPAALLGASISTVQKDVDGILKSSVRQSGIVRMSSHVDEWISTGVDARAGDLLSVVAEGSWDPGFGRPMEPKNLIWIRIGASGSAFNLRRDSQSFVAQADGVIQILVHAISFTDLRQDPTGNTRSPLPAAIDRSLDMSVLIVAWAEGKGDTLSTNPPNDWIAPLLNSRHASVPRGFEHLVFVSDSTAFSDWTSEDGARGIKILPNVEAAIIRKPLDISLNGRTEISFDWRYVSLPAQGDERQAPFHDYMSIAVEFDNGQDITWMWAKFGEPGTIYSCPLPWWDKHETHMILQSGIEDLGEWFHHIRIVQADYRAGVDGSAPPTKIVAIWFIGNNAFGMQHAEAYMKNVRIVSSGEETRIF